MEKIKTSLISRIGYWRNQQQKSQQFKKLLEEFFKQQYPERTIVSQLVASHFKEGIVFLETTNKAVAQELAWRQNELKAFFQKKSWSVKKVVVR